MEDTNSFWHSRRTVAAGLALTAVAALGVWAATSGGSDHHAATATYESACGLHGGSTAAPTTGPDVQWQNVDGNWLPVSNTQGPGNRTAGGPWSCYAHTPTGAVLAAWGIPAGMTGANFAKAVKEQTAPGPGQDALLKAGPGSTPTTAVPVGFRLNSYDGNSATVTLYVRQQGIVARCTSAVQWTGGAKGDWLLQLTPDGSLRSSCEQVPDLAGPGVLAWGPNQ